MRPCACCGYLTVEHEYDICPVCWWEADSVQERDPSFGGGANETSLAEARISFVSIGAIDARALAFVRPPLDTERPA
jgi:hypothetical protein